MRKEVIKRGLGVGFAWLLSGCNEGGITQQQIEEVWRERVPVTMPGRVPESATSYAVQPPEPTSTLTATATSEPTATLTPPSTSTPTIMEYFEQSLESDWKELLEDIDQGDIGPNVLPAREQWELMSKIARVGWNCRNESRNVRGAIVGSADLFVRYPRVVKDLNNRLPPDSEDCVDTAYVLGAAAACYREGEHLRNQAAYSFMWWFEQDEGYSDDQKREILREIIEDKCETMLQAGESAE